MATLEFLGATGTVTGSKHLVEAGGQQILVDCGLYQGLTALRLRNWERLPVDPASIDWVVLTHGHIDHTGYLPRLIKDGFKGRVLATRATADLLKLLLPDSGHLQEEEATYHNKRGTSQHRPAFPLYTKEEGRAAAKLVEGVAYGEPRALVPGIAVTFRRAGHILGSATVTLDLGATEGRRRIVFSGDLGRYGAPILPDPMPIEEADYIVVESTHGDRQHAPEPIAAQRARRPRSRTSPRDENRKRVGLDGRRARLSRPGGDRVSTMTVRRGGFSLSGSVALQYPSPFGGSDHAWTEDSDDGLAHDGRGDDGVCADRGDDCRADEDDERRHEDDE
jgi:ribonuclease BN (tRNA processing enzyme)